MTPSVDAPAHWCSIPPNRVGPSPWPAASTATYRLCGTCEQLDFKHLQRDDSFPSNKAMLEHGLGGIRGNKGTCDLCAVFWHALHKPVGENSDGSYPDQTHVVIHCPDLAWLPHAFRPRPAYKSSYVLASRNNPDPAYAIAILVPPHVLLCQELKDSEWGARAWVFQETYFSRRVVRFGASHIYWACWACREFTACQTSPWHETLDDWMAQEDVFVSSRGSGGHLVRHWMKVLQRYSRTRLTYPSNRFPAIAAVAREWELALGRSYAAGLSVDPESLLWIRRATTRDSDRWGYHHRIEPFMRNTEKFTSHIKPTDIQLLRSGDEHSHHQSALVFSSFVRAATRSPDPVDHGVVPMHGYVETMRGLTYHAVSNPGHDGFVILDDPGSAPIDFELLSIGGCLVEIEPAYNGLNLSLAVERTMKPEHMRAGDLPQNSYRRLGIAFHVRGNFVSTEGYPAPAHALARSRSDIGTYSGCRTCMNGHGLGALIGGG
ncbi:hypothetical protein GGTG_04325 [Gaeumannomyces tritici R3-111a-1]|uniref:Heterokaryon incompatibility domain-containing protein n=1 Tax=Gaeumannomyces tritici (strain R3-111a-1) TaxID=644352 RepID=J3NSS6_GAET3|nr:hypothetical protein GGTG_04325 [Gaeumannomyces tritici R3-111a-1]EJT79239.1 hypothetical protein GGTG_04325 [Gaeumannomyces tritici R3-111a-1]